MVKKVLDTVGLQLTAVLVDGEIGIEVDKMRAE
jgi:hypothetical protein